LGVALVSALIGFSATRAQGPPLAADAPADAPTPLSKSCQIGATTIAEELPLPNVAAALAQRKTLRILAIGAAPGRVGSHGNGYTAVIEAILSHALKGIDVVIINRGVSGELAANAATRMKNEVALVEPDLVLWQVGTNDALAYVPVGEFTTTVKDQIDWLTKHKVDVLLVGLQFANQVLHDAQYAEVRDALRKHEQPHAVQQTASLFDHLVGGEILGFNDRFGAPLSDRFHERLVITFGLIGIIDCKVAYRIVKNVARSDVARDHCGVARACMCAGQRPPARFRVLSQ
jgi:hypothetical protein